MKKIIILIISIFMLSSCYDYKELNDIDIVDSIFIEYKDDKYIVNLEIIKSSKDDNGTSNEVSYVKGKDKNLNIAINKAISNSEKSVYLKHVNLLVIDKKTTKKGISNIIDYIIRDVKINDNFNVVYTKNIDDLYKINKDNESISDMINNNLNLSINTGSMFNVDNIAIKLLNKYQDVAIPCININNDKVYINKVLLFNKDKYYKVIDNKIYNFLLLDSNTNLFSDDDNVIDIDKKKIDYEINKDNININIKGLSKIVNVDGIDLNNDDEYNKLSNRFNTVIENEIYEFINEINDSDVLGIKNMYYRKYNKEIDKIDISINVDININKNGAILEGLND